MSLIPKVLFKYRVLSNEEQISRVLGIIDKHELYFPTREKLNDPFEGIAGPIQVQNGGYAGISLHLAIDHEIPYLQDIRNQYRILSLSGDCFSPLMWALYADEGKGICLCFRTDASFSKARRVKYLDPVVVERVIPQDVLEKTIEEDLYTKSIDWQFEKEWRIIEKSDDHHFSFLNDDLVAVIFGYSIDDEIKSRIKAILPDRTKAFTGYVGRQTKRIRLLPDEYRLVIDGSKPPFLDTLFDLNNAIFG